MCPPFGGDTGLTKTQTAGKGSLLGRALERAEFAQFSRHLCADTLHTPKLLVANAPQIAERPYGSRLSVLQMPEASGPTLDVPIAQNEHLDRGAVWKPGNVRSCAICVYERGMPVLLKEKAFDDLANASPRHSEFRGDGRGVLAELALTDDCSVSLLPRVG
ncbi:MAG: hypothetical protein AB7O44_31545 [Hyphomicrobiaceae bacterium]